MELFLIYVITRLTELKSALENAAWVTGLLLAGTLVILVVNELVTDAGEKKAPLVPLEEAPWTNEHHDTYTYQRIRAVLGRARKLLVPAFVVAFSLNMFVPSTRDAVVIAGGYGLVEAVKSDRAQRLFSKSTQVASQWLDAQLTPADVPTPKANNRQLPDSGLPGEGAAN